MWHGGGRCLTEIELCTYSDTHKASLNKFKKIKITPSIISDYNRIKLDLNNKINPRKYSNT
jgi:hypothetical protein